MNSGERENAAALRHLLLPLPASPSTQVALVIDATLGRQPVEVIAEYAAPRVPGAKGSWKLGWRWDLGTMTLGDVAGKVWPGLGELPEGVGGIQPRDIHAEYFSGALCRALSFGIGDLSFVYLKEEKTPSAATCWGLVHDKPIEIPITGLVAQLLGKQVTLSRLRVGSVSGAFDEQSRNEASGQLTEARLLLGAAGAPPAGFVAGVTMEGVGAAPIALPFGDGAPGKGAGAPGVAEAPGGGTSAGATPAPVDTSDGLRKWFPVNKTMGPLRVARVGCEWTNGKIGLLLDAAVDTGPLRLGLIGLAIRLPPSDPKPKNLEVGLEGIDVSYRAGSVAISGGFLRSEVTVDGERTVQYDGAVLIKFADLSITGLGSYAAVRGEPSLFIFAILQKELGGPVFFRVNGLAAGFGYNRKLKLPSIEEVESFPLVRAALEQDYFAKAGAEDPIQVAMRKLRNYIPPAIGEYWFSVGVRFNSFELLQSFALLSVSFGSDLTISILGLSALTVPTRLPPNLPPLCYAELALRAELNPSVGILSVQARVTSNSYVFDKSSKLTGGFAFFTWFKAPHEGDFVVTLGGYHPKFLPPPHYPLVPRLGLNWVVSSQVRIAGELYFALTPSCLMAGGKLSAVYDAGWVRAWFIAYADFLIAWKPFHYDIAMGVSLGVRVTLRANMGLFTIAISISFELGTDLHLWGPPFAGTARVKFYIVSFTVRFGNQEQREPEPIAWDEFSQSFLPKPDSVCSVAFTGGLLQEWRRDDGRSVAVVDGHEFAFSVQSQAPCTTIRWAKESEKGSDDWAGQLGVAPMYAADLVSTLSVEVRSDDGNSVAADLFQTSVVRKGFPDALWGKGKPVLSRPASKVLPQVPAGLAVALSAAGKQSQIRHSLPPMKLEVFEYELIPKDIRWSGIPLPADIEGTDTLSNTLWGNSAVSDKRAAVLAALAGVTAHPLNEVFLPETAARAATIFQALPTPAALGQLLPEEK